MLIDYLTGLITTAFRGSKKTESMSAAMDERVKAALDVLNAKENKDEPWAIKWDYDYAFIKYALDKLLVGGCEKLSNLSNPKFVKYIKGLGVINCCGDKTLNKYHSKISGNFPNCRFAEVNHQETRRRNAIINKFVELM